MKIKTLYFAILVAITLSSNAQWVTQASGFSTTGLGINDISIVNANVVWATAFDTSGIAAVNKFTRTINGGTTWTPGSITGAAALDLTSISAYNKDTAWVSMLDNTNGGGAIYRTNNGGTTWAAQATATFAAPGGSTDFVYMFDKNNGVCVGDSNGGYWEIYKTVNGGTNWARVVSGNIPVNQLGEIGGENIYSVIGSTIWFGTSTGRVYKSTNMGAIWTATTTGLTSVTRLAFKDANNGIATDGTSLVKTTNGGATWTTLAFTGNLYETGLAYIPGTVGTYVSTGSKASGALTNGSSYSLNDGATWINIDAVGHSSVAFLNSTTGWSGGINTSSTVAGMYKWNGSFTTGIKNNEYVKGVSINVYPNPFSTQVNITVESESGILSNLAVEVYDVLGNSVLKRDFNENKTILSRENLKEGIYFYKVYNTNTIVGTGRLLIQ
ncbi:MAG: T9SS type A sorting domain-containing protein [Bacteroidetes bacterium]|nr:T9SS type A sorting domain-containing protein [Bacteroidota bacterium]